MALCILSHCLSLMYVSTGLGGVPPRPSAPVVSMPNATTALGLVFLLGGGAAAQQSCELQSLFQHLEEIQESCCEPAVESETEPPVDNACVSGYPGADDACEQRCGEIFEPFWDACGEMLPHRAMNKRHAPAQSILAVRSSRATRSGKMHRSRTTPSRAKGSRRVRRPHGAAAPNGSIAVQYLTPSEGRTCFGG